MANEPLTSGEPQDEDGQDGTIHSFDATGLTMDELLIAKATPGSPIEQEMKRAVANLKDPSNDVIVCQANTEPEGETP